MRREMRRRLLRWGGGAAALLALFLVGFLLFLAEIPEELADPARRTDGIVVLTGGAERVETGLRLLESGAAPRLLVSGVAARLTLAELARAHAREPGALTSRITLGHAAATTVGNAAETTAWARANDVRSLRVVTAGYHMPRALLELRRAMPETELLPHPVGPTTLREGALGPARVARLHLSEYVKYLLAAGGLSKLLPARDPGRR
jgi:uncharacterized SAM-binding protein YcdF (DUF218 family)